MDIFDEFDGTFGDIMGDFLGYEKKNKRRWSWTNKQQARLQKVKSILDNLRNYWPVTLRQLYYQLVSKNIIENKRSAYNSLSKLVKYARLDDYIPWEAIEDRLRQANLNSGWSDKEEFLRGEVDNFLNGYRRHLQQGQKNYIEIWIEKDALASIFQRVADPFCIPVCICRGFSSVSFLNDLRDRLMRRLQKKQRPILLYFGDLDPSGEEMLPSMKLTLEAEMGVLGVTYKKIALTKDDVKRYDLPHNPNAVKKTDSRYRKFVKKYGLYAVELDALPPDILQKRIKEAITENIDLSQFNQETEKAKKEELILVGFKEKMKDWVDQNWKS